VSLRSRVLGALGTVYDPELDEPITALRFVSSCEVSAAGDVDVRLRLPTPQCAPNFAYLMAADARAAVRRLPEVGAVSVVLEDHYTGAEINAAVGRGDAFAQAFPGETEGDVGALRGLFQRKALVMRQSRVCEALLAGGMSEEELTSLRVADLPDGPDARRCVELRRALGIGSDPAAPAFVSPGGAPIAPEDLRLWLRKARGGGPGREAQGGICRALLATRYGIRDSEEVAA
jgi:metal-sulfur cluster biosynthetic enzyme